MVFLCERISLYIDAIIFDYTICQTERNSQECKSRQFRPQNIITSTVA